MAWPSRVGCHVEANAAELQRRCRGRSPAKSAFVNKKVNRFTPRISLPRIQNANIMADCIGGPPPCIVGAPAVSGPNLLPRRRLLYVRTPRVGGSRAGRSPRRVHNGKDLL